MGSIITPAVVQFHEIFVKKEKIFCFIIIFLYCNNKNFVKSELKTASISTGSNITLN